VMTKKPAMTTTAMIKRWSELLTTDDAIFHFQHHIRKIN
jgi:hypothetical protein